MLAGHTFEWVTDNWGASPSDFDPKDNEGRDSRLRGTTMKPEYDFSKGERSRFFRPHAELRLPIYLNADVQAYLSERAAQTGFH